MQEILKANDKPGGTPNLTTGLVKVGNNKAGIYFTNYDADRFSRLLIHIRNSADLEGFLSFIEIAELEELIRVISKASP